VLIEERTEDLIDRDPPTTESEEEEEEDDDGEEEEEFREREFCIVVFSALRSSRS